MLSSLLRLPTYYRNLYAPERFQGGGRNPPYFEGWYFKLVDATGRQRWAIIPAIFLSDDPSRRHCFIQVLDGLTGTATYHRYPVQEFEAASDAFQVRVGRSTFSADGIRLDIDDELRTVRGEVRIEGRTPWPVRWHSPGIMGPFGLIPIMECYHGVVSMDHGLRGELTIDGAKHDFSGGRGYIEKDWGRSFPAGYVWMQTNHFDDPRTSFMGSIAIIPWVHTAFAGFLLGFLHDGRLHRFATYTGARTERLSITDDHVHWVVAGSGKRIAIEAERARGGLLLGPTREDMSSRVGETMLSKVRVTVTEPGRILFDGTGRHAGLEVHGDLDRLRALQK